MVTGATGADRRRRAGRARRRLCGAQRPLGGVPGGAGPGLAGAEQVVAGAVGVWLVCVGHVQGEIPQQWIGHLRRTVGMAVRPVSAGVGHRAAPLTSCSPSTLHPEQPLVNGLVATMEDIVALL